MLGGFSRVRKIKYDLRALSNLNKTTWSGHIVLGSGTKDFYPNLIPGQPQ